MAIPKQKLAADAVLPIAAAEILSALPDAVLVADAAGMIFYCNGAAEQFFNISSKNIIGAALGDLFGLSHPLLATLSTAGTVTLHDMPMSEGGRVSATVSSMPPENLLRVVSLKMAHGPVQDRWIEKTRMALKPAQHMARVLGHEIKNPLSGISGAARLLEQSAATGDDRELAQLIGREAARILRLIQRVSMLDDSMPPKFDPVNLHEVLDHVRQVQAAAGGAMRASYDPSLPHIEGNADQLEQAVLNLVRNAAEAGATEITLRTRYATSPVIHPETGARLPICVEVEDNGAGIPEAARERLFEPYFTTKPQGEGLGLSIVSRIVDDHGGTVQVETVRGRTLFRLSFARGGGARYVES